MLIVTINEIPGKNAVAGNARGILHNGKALAAQLIEQGGFAHVGASHHCYDRFAHGVSSFLKRGKIQ